MKKVIVFGLLAVCMCTLMGCTDSQSIDGAIDQSIERQEDAKEAVSEYNEDVQELQDAAEEIESQ